MHHSFTRSSSRNLLHNGEIVNARAGRGRAMGQRPPRRWNAGGGAGFVRWRRAGADVALRKKAIQKTPIRQAAIRQASAERERHRRYRAIRQGAMLKSLLQKLGLMLGGAL